MAKVTGPRTADERCFLNKKAGCLGKQGPREACTQSSFSQQGASFPEGEQDKPGAGGAAGERGTPKIPVLFTDVPHTVCQALCAVTGMKKTRFPLSFPAKSCGAFAGEGKVSLCNVMGGGKAWGGVEPPFPPPLAPLVRVPRRLGHCKARDSGRQTQSLGLAAPLCQQECPRHLSFSRY